LIPLARAVAPFSSLEEVWRRAGVPVAALACLADADAFDSLSLIDDDGSPAVDGFGKGGGCGEERSREGTNRHRPKERMAERALNPAISQGNLMLTKVKPFNVERRKASAARETRRALDDHLKLFPKKAAPAVVRRIEIK
jgi:hypothetical protein